MSYRHPLPERPVFGFIDGDPCDPSLYASSSKQPSPPALPPPAPPPSFMPYRPLATSYQLSSVPGAVVDIKVGLDNARPSKAARKAAWMADQASFPEQGSSAVANAREILERSVRSNSRTIIGKQREDAPQSAVAHSAKVKVKVKAKEKEKEKGKGKRPRSDEKAISRAWLAADHERARLIRLEEKQARRERSLHKLQESPLPIKLDRLPTLLEIENEAWRRSVFEPHNPDGSRSDQHRWLEWQGDAHLNAFITDKLVEDYRDITIGKADKLRNYMRSNLVFAHIATHYGFLARVPSFASHAADNLTKRLADVFEAYVGALQKVAKGNHAKEAALAGWLHKVFGPKVFTDMERFVRVIEVEDSSDEDEQVRGPSGLSEEDPVSFEGDSDEMAWQSFAEEERQVAAMVWDWGSDSGSSSDVEWR